MRAGRIRLLPEATVKVASLAGRPRVSGSPSSIDTTATAGTVSPMLASAEPSARFRLVCMRLAAAARTAAQVSGSSTSKAMATPTTEAGAPAARTPPSMAGASVFARPTTATRQTISKPKASAASRAEGGSAWASSSPVSAGRK